MKTIAIVDDSKADRYTVKRRLIASGLFDEVKEFEAGDVFLKDYFIPMRVDPDALDKLVVLMDINMPRMGGFETIEEMERQLDSGNGMKSCVVMMYSSSNNPLDQQKAKNFDIVKGYIVKPFSAEDIESIKCFF